MLASGIVNSCTDASLRAALNGGGTVTFDCDGTIILTNTLIIGLDSVLDGTGHKVVISGNKSVRLFQVSTGITFIANNLTLADGMHQGLKSNVPGTPGGNGLGAGILNLGGTVTLVNCTLSNHIAQGGFGPDRGGQAQGAAVCNLGGELHLTNCVLAGNLAKGGGTSTAFTFFPGGGYGGALYTVGGGVAAHGCTFATNSAVGDTEGGPFGMYSGTGGPAHGGALYATSSVVHVNGSLFYSNTCFAGGAFPGQGGVARGGALEIASVSGVVSNSTFLFNVAGAGASTGVGGEGFGGGIDSSAELWLLNSRLSSNSVIGGGIGFLAGRGFGGGLSGRGPLSVSDCAFDGNSARGGRGGSGAFASYAGTNGCGGAIYSASDLRATNNTLVGNRAWGGDADSFDFSGTFKLGAAGQGGGICISNGAAIVAHATIYGNTAKGGVSVNGVQANLAKPRLGPAQGGGIAILSGTTMLYNSILASNISGSNCFGMVIDGGNNISSDASCAFTQPGSLINTDPRLGPFADYGGPTPTMPLLIGSPAIDAAAPTACASIDQRGITRPYGAGCDVGAFESAPPYTIRGYVRGYLSSNGTAITVGTAVTNPGASGFFVVNGLSPGSYTLTPSAQDAVFVLSNQIVNVGPDIVDAEFHSYRSNAWNVVGLGHGLVRLVLAGAPGDAYQVLDSTNLTQWSLLTNGVMPSSGIVALDQPADQRARFFKSPAPP